MKNPQQPVVVACNPSTNRQPLIRNYYYTTCAVVDHFFPLHGPESTTILTDDDAVPGGVHKSYFIHHYSCPAATPLHPRFLLFSIFSSRGRSPTNERRGSFLLQKPPLSPSSLPILSPPLTICCSLSDPFSRITGTSSSVARQHGSICH